MITIATTRYVDARGVPWEIVTYDETNPLTGTPVVLYGFGYSGGVFGVPDVKSAVPAIDAYAETHARRVLPLDDAHREVVIDPDGTKKYVYFRDADKVAWNSYRITDPGDGPVGYFAVNTTPFSSEIVGPSPTSMQQYYDFRDYQLKKGRVPTTTAGLGFAGGYGLDASGASSEPVRLTAPATAGMGSAVSDVPASVPGGVPGALSVGDTTLPSLPEAAAVPWKPIALGGAVGLGLAWLLSWYRKRA